MARHRQGRGRFSRNVSISEARAIADAFGVTIDRLIGRRGLPRPQTALFVLQRLHEAVADAGRAMRIAARDITTALAEVNETDDTLTDMATAVQVVTGQLDAAAGELLA